jgi:hypothetical protein
MEILTNVRQNLVNDIRSLQMGKRILSKLAVGSTLGLAVILSTGGALHAQQASIQTVFASYGYGADRKDAKDDVAKLCDGKPSCSFMVKNESFPTKQPIDPSPGNDKGLMVGWKCGDVAHKVQFAEGRNATVDCK